MFDVKGVDIKIEIPAPEDFNTIKDHYNLIQIGMQDISKRRDSARHFIYFEYDMHALGNVY